MDTHQLAAFKVAYECGSMAKAAERLFITPQGLSRSIASLEAELGQALFVRTNRGVQPTAFARRLYPNACKIARLLDAVEQDAHREGTRETVEVASVSGGLAYFGPGLAEDFAATRPDLELAVTEGDDRQTAQRVRDCTAACGIVAGPVDFAEFEATLVARHPHALVVRADSDLAGRAAVGFADLDGRRVGVMGRGFAPYSYVQERLVRAGVRPVEVVGFAEMYTGVVRARSEDICLVTVDFLIPPGSDAGLAVAPFDDREFTWDEYLVVRNDVPPDDGAAAFRDFLVPWFRTHEARLFPWRTPHGTWPLSGSRAS